MHAHSLLFHSLNESLHTQPGHTCFNQTLWKGLLWWIIWNVINLCSTEQEGPQYLQPYNEGKRFHLATSYLPPICIRHRQIIRPLSGNKRHNKQGLNTKCAARLSRLCCNTKKGSEINEETSTRKRVHTVHIATIIPLKRVLLFIFCMGGLLVRKYIW